MKKKMAKSEIVFTFEDIKKASLPQAVDPKNETPKQQNNLQGLKVSFKDSPDNVSYQGTTPSGLTTIFTKSAGLDNLKKLGSFSSTSSSTVPTNNFSTFEKTTTNVGLESIKNPISKLARFTNIKSQKSGGMIVYQGNKTLTDYKSSDTTPENYEISTRGADVFSTTTTGKLITASIENIVEKGSISGGSIFTPKFVSGTIKTIEKSTSESKGNTEILFDSNSSTKERFKAFTNLTSGTDFYKNTSAQGITTSDNGFLNNFVNSSDSRKAWIKGFTLSDDSNSVYNAKQTDAETRYKNRIALAEIKNNAAIAKITGAKTQQAIKQRDAAVLKTEAENTYKQTISELDQRLVIISEEGDRFSSEYFDNLEKAQDTFNKEIANSASIEESMLASQKYNDTVTELNNTFTQVNKEQLDEIGVIEKEAEQADTEYKKTLATIDKDLDDAQKKVDKAVDAQAKTDKKLENLKADVEALTKAESLGLSVKDLNQTQLKYSESVGFQSYLSLNTSNSGSDIRDDGWEKSFSSIFNKNTAKEVGNTFADLGLSLLTEIASQNLNGWVPRNGKLAADSYERFKTFTRDIGYNNVIGFLDFDQYYYKKPSIVQILGSDGVEFKRIQRYYEPDTRTYVTSENDFVSYTRTVRFIQDSAEHAEAVQDAKYDGVTSTIRKANLAIADSNIFIEKDYEQPVADTILDHNPTKIDLVERALANLVQPSENPFTNGYIHEMISKNPLLTTSQYHLFIKPLKENNNINTAFYKDGQHSITINNVTGIKNLDKTTRWLQSTEGHYNLDNQGNFKNEKTHYSTVSDWKNFRIKGLPISAFDRQSAGINYGVQVLNLIPNLQAGSEYKAEITIVCDRTLDELEYLNLITGVGIYKGTGDYDPNSKGTKVFNLSAVSDSDYSYCDDAYLRIRNGRDLMKSLFAEELNRNFGDSEVIKAIYYKVPVFHFHNFRIINTGNSFKFEPSNQKPLELKATVTWSRLSIDWEEPADIYYSELSDTTTENT